ncbi:PDZ domain-containing protein [Chryseobacterium wangxinyae]|uniref:PDZ domain-containing protein n=1 Tax=Chryseobacterium sp. CY353 TaxID=2997334 RepID=UPI00226FCB60|nr:PDZ domain-containing protein [Chryseobacterium sp. CY353]MCY0967841.1 PDZ domain-containing protein [Chryseobacterium sp. CY353]
MKSVLLLVTIFFSIITDAQNSFELKDAKKTVIPFKLINNLIFIPITVNGADLTFMLDTGVSETTIFSLENKEMILAPLEQMRFSGLGGNESIEGFKSDHNIGKIGKNFVNESFTLFIILDQDFNISSHVGIPVNGIIGYHFFKNHPLIIDYASKKITIYQENEVFKKKIKRFNELPISIERNKPYVFADVEMTNDKKSSKLLIDLGNSDAIWLFPTLIKNFVYNRPNIDDFLGRGFNGDIYGKRSRIHNFYLGDFKFVKPLTAMPDEFSIQHVNLVGDRKGSVGGEIMRRFTTAFDYPNQKLYLKKNGNFEDHFHFNMSGLDFQQDGMQWEKDLVNLESRRKDNGNTGVELINNSLQYKFVLKPLFSIAGVRKDSPGDKAGFAKGDQLISINGRKTSEMTLKKIMGLMKSDEGKTINMVIVRKNQELRLSFTLEDPIPYQE